MSEAAASKAHQQDCVLMISARTAIDTLMWVGKTARPQPYTKNHRQLRSAQSGGRAHQSVNKFQMVISEDAIKSDAIQTEQVIFRNTYV